MVIRYEEYRNIVNDGGFLQALDNGDAGGGGVTTGPTSITQPTTPSGYFDQQIVGIPATVPQAVVESAVQAQDTIVITPQVLAEGFGSYLADILPPDIAVTAGAFGASMQQIKNITQVPVEKFAQVVASIETTQGLNLVNGTNVPTDITEAQIAYELIALGTGPYKTFTYSDFFGCMSGLPYAWQQLQTGLTDLQTNNLVNIYQTLYDTIITGPNPLDPTPIASFNTAVQTQIDAANTEIALIRTVRPGASMDLNDLYNKFGTQLGNEQLVRNTGLSPLPNVVDPTAARDGYINKYPITIYSFVDSLPQYGKQTQPHMAAQTLEAISDLTFGAGQSIIAAMREARNQDRLNYIGVSLDNNIPDFIIQQKELIANTPVITPVLDGNGNVISNVTTLVGNTIPAYPNTTDPLGYYDPLTQTYNVYVVPISPNTKNNTNPNVPGGGTGGGLVPISTGLVPGLVPAGTGRPAKPVDTGGPKVPGSLAKSPYQNLIPPQLNTLFTSDVLLPAQYSVPEAIEHVITCNCDCWV
jgi:hypothetical protein